MNRHSQPSRTKAPQPARRQRGSIVVYLALALVVFGVMAMAGAGRFGASIMGVSTPNCATQARLMAESGVRYAMARLRTATDLAATIVALDNLTVDVNAAKGLKFTLTVKASGTDAAQVSALGSACGGVTALPTTSTQASAAGGVNVPAANSGPIDFSNVADDFFRTTDLLGSSPISVDPATKSISFGLLEQRQNAAAIWYSGNATGGCVDGNCTMTYGLRAYFDVLWTANSYADGLVFGVLSAETNKLDAVGGTKFQGELMGWGGPGTSGVGIQPPKLGLEFDTYHNDCNTPIYVAGSRCDDSNGWDHLAYVFWGSNVSLDTYHTYNSTEVNIPIKGPTYDDNRHGAGAGNASEPISLANPDGKGSGRFGYYYGTYSEWLKGKASYPAIAPVKYAIRYELSRIGKVNSEGNSPYVLKTWVRSGAVTSPYNDVTANYTAAAPDILRVIHLTPALHAQMAKVLFGWSEATGDSTQKLTVSDFNLMFKKTADTLTIPGNYTVYWNMNVAAPGTTTGSVPVVTPPAPTNYPSAPTTYPYGKALSFAADAGRVYVGDSNSLDLTSQGTIAAWIYPTTLGTAANNTYILHKGTATNTSGEAYSLRISSGDKLELMIRDNSGSLAVESAALPAVNRWYHVVAQWDSDVMVIYINGMLSNINTKPSNRAARGTNAALVIGARQTSASNPGSVYYGFNGYIDEIYLYKRLLTAEEIAAMSLM
ncbi:MAG: LamG domain-containing protein [Humidesulfovibrio sp.]|nr:LamG domain-containing protein [Humidesulfovibrio sp.]